MLSNEKTVKWLLKHRVDEYGNVKLNGLDFTSANCSVWFSEIKVTKSLYQDLQEVGEDLFQGGQKVKGNLLQCNQYVEGKLDQCLQSVKGDLISHKLIEGEHWEDYETLDYVNPGINSVIRKCNLKPITREELKKMGYVLKED